MRLFHWVRYAVETFDHPVSITNGYGGDRGVSEMSQEQLRKLFDLFKQRKQRRIDLTWMEEREGKLTYRGREVKTKLPLVEEGG